MSVICSPKTPLFLVKINVPLHWVSTLLLTRKCIVCSLKCVGCYSPIHRTSILHPIGRIDFNIYQSASHTVQRCTQAYDIVANHSYSGGRIPTFWPNEDDYER